MEPIESLNRQLMDLYGIDTVSGDPIWRIVWSDSQIEKARITRTPEGLELMFPTVMEVPKYPYIKERWVLERLVLIPEINQDELPASKKSYEPMWTYQTGKGDFVYPTMPATQFIVDTVYAALGKQSLAKYKEDEKFTTEEGRLQRVDELEEELFGNETEIGDALHYKEGIVVPSSFKPTQEN